MSASLSAVDRPVPTVAIVGTDAVLAAAPATPVQLAHACLRRGFTVAVPASWGDELVAAETLRRLATKERGPAVMCVCPMARARLLAPGPDLARFLVSIVPPPVATARYVRSAYGTQDVHITYIGGCPGADDPSIDARLTPDAFIVDLAEHGVALTEQPLVFDSIVPPDRRRWCSVPGGVPNAESLSAEPDGRSVIEMGRDDVTTELAQHILAREHVLLDLAPSLGCVCSGAVAAVSPARARAAAMAAEPPRALSPVIDAATVVSLDAPVGEPSASASIAVFAPSAASPAVRLERVLDELLGAGTPDVGQTGESSTSIITSAIILDIPVLPTIEADTAYTETRELETIPAEVVAVAPLTVEDSSVGAPPVEAAVAHSSVEESDVEHSITGEASEAASLTAADTTQEPDAALGVVADHGSAATSAFESVVADPIVPGSTVRRRTPPATLRYPGSSVPKAALANGRALPRAYVAKRRTPPAGAMAISADRARGPVSTPSSAADETLPNDVAIPLTVAIEPTVEPIAATASHAVDVHTELDTAPVEPSELPASAPVIPTAAAMSAAAPEPVAAVTANGDHVASTSAPEAPSSQPPAPSKAASEPTPDSAAGTGPTTAGSANHPALMFLLVTTLIALAVFVLLTLRQ